MIYANVFKFCLEPLGAWTLFLSALSSPNNYLLSGTQQVWTKQTSSASRLSAGWSRAHAVTSIWHVQALSGVPHPWNFPAGSRLPTSYPTGRTVSRSQRVQRLRWTFRPSRARATRTEWFHWRSSSPICCCLICQDTCWSTKASFSSKSTTPVGLAVVALVRFFWERTRRNLSLWRRSTPRGMPG